MERRPERIDNIIKSIFNKLDKASSLTSDEITKIWREAAGKKASLHTKPESFRKKKLIINVDSSSWLYELTLKKNELLKGLKKRLGEDEIKELQFRIGEI